MGSGGSGLREDGAGRAGRSAPDVSDSTAWVAAYGELYAPMVRLAGLLVCDYQFGEEIAQDAFARLIEVGASVTDPASYLRATVTNLCRSRLRRAILARRHRLEPAVAHPKDAADQVADELVIRDALGRLPRRQREAVVLRYFADLSEAETSKVMGVSAGSVKTHLHRGLRALAASLGEPE